MEWKEDYSDLNNPFYYNKEMQLIEYIPPAWYPFLLTWATYLLDLYQRCYAQSLRMLNAVLQTFSDEVVGFTDTSLLPYDCSRSTRGVQFYDAEVYCIYNVTKGTIKVVDRNRPHVYRQWRSQWLAISVRAEDTPLGDVSSWLEGIKVEHNLDACIPLKWLLLCYAYATSTELKFLDLDKYTFSVITEEAEEVELNYKGDRIEQESDTLVEDTASTEVIHAEADASPTARSTEVEVEADAVANA